MGLVKTHQTSIARVGAVRPFRAVPVDEAQRITVNATGGQWDCTFNGETVVGLSATITAAALQTELEGLSTIGVGNVRVTGGPGDATGSAPYDVTFINNRGGNNQPQMTVASNSATPLSDPDGVTSVTATTLTEGSGQMPPDWLYCDGRAVSRTAFAALFAAIGTSFGAGDGSTTFNLPPLLGRVPKYTTTVGTKGGQGTVWLNSSHMPAHTHGVSDPGHGHSVSNGGSHDHSTNGGDPWAWDGGSFGSANGGSSSLFYRTTNPGTHYGFDAVTITINIGATNPFPATTSEVGTSNPSHSNVQPSRAVAYIIRAR